MKEELYRIDDVSYSYLGQFPALNKVSLRIDRGERVVILGANGSGKSTLLLILAGLIFPQNGAIRYSGETLTETGLADEAFRRLFRSSVGIVFQNSDIQLFSSSVQDELLFGLTQLDLSDKEISERVRKYSDLMSISHLIDRHPQYLSIGEKKRVALASVFAMEPAVLLMDEPTAGLDPRTSRHLIDSVSAFSEKGATVIMTTQDIHIVPEIADRVIVFGEDKRIVKDGNAEEVLRDISFLQEHNLVHIHAHKHKDKVHVHPHEHPSHDHPHPA